MNHLSLEHTALVVMCKLLREYVPQGMMGMEAKKTTGAKSQMWAGLGKDLELHPVRVLMRAVEVTVFAF